MFIGWDIVVLLPVLLAEESHQPIRVDGMEMNRTQNLDFYVVSKWDEIVVAQIAWADSDVIHYWNQCVENQIQVYQFVNELELGDSSRSGKLLELLASDGMDKRFNNP